MNIQSKSLRRYVSPLVAIAVLATATMVTAREPFTKAELKVADDKLTQSAKRGYDMWYGARADMANNGLACANCHPDAAATNPQTFPKYMPQTDRVMAYREGAMECSPFHNLEALKAFRFVRAKGITLPETADSSEYIKISQLLLAGSMRYSDEK